MFMVNCTFPTPERWGGERKGGRGSNTSHHCPHPCYMCPKTEERQRDVLWQFRAGVHPGSLGSEGLTGRKEWEKSQFH